MLRAMTDRASRILWSAIWTVLGAAALITLLVLNATAREVATETAKTLFGIFTTPFILEATVALTGIFIVLAINHWRLKKEGDGWVYLVSQEPDQSAGKLPAAITQRLQGVVMQDKPEAVDEAATARANVEGFLELGMAAQAAQALEEFRDLPDDEATAALRIRVLAANLDTGAAQALVHESAGRFAGKEALWVQTALECAGWIEAHAQQQQAALQFWREQAGRLAG
jgi:uncharacterized integral membrane protein